MLAIVAVRRATEGEAHLDRDARQGKLAKGAVEHGRFSGADCQAECNISLKTSLAVLYFRTFLGLSQISSTVCRISSSVTLLKSLPLGEELSQEPVGVLNC
ncbi:MAG: hypothetical protein DUD39_07320 [Coriobacteriaceae bacterium]|nr:MAG: hypothetical protein DUD39_07320 [Coriobacteriaceae bacterium]